MKKTIALASVLAMGALGMACGETPANNAAKPASPANTMKPATPPSAPASTTPTTAPATSPAAPASGSPAKAPEASPAKK